MQEQEPYALESLSHAERGLEKLPHDIKARVIAAILRLPDNPRPHGCLKLRGQDAWRIRIGNYRVRYKISDERRVVTIVAVGHRRNFYDDL